jgi:hypothetical protein
VTDDDDLRRRGAEPPPQMRGLVDDDALGVGADDASRDLRERIGARRARGLVRRR